MLEAPAVRATLEIGIKNDEGREFREEALCFQIG